jgi:hypothetical protein
MSSRSGILRIPLVLWALSAGFATALATSASAQDPPCGREVVISLTSAEYQAAFNTMTGQGKLPIWVDGYEVAGETFLNAIFSDCDPKATMAYHDRSGANHATDLASLAAQGYRLAHVDSYLIGSTVVYASIYVLEEADWVSYFGQDAATHQSTFDARVAEGYRPRVISAVRHNDALELTSLYVNEDIGSFATLTNLTSAQYQDFVNEQGAAGRTPSYLNAFTNGGAKFSVIFDETLTSPWVARHNLSGLEFLAEHENWTSQDLEIQLVTGYDGSERFGAVWSAPEPGAGVQSAAAVFALLVLRARARHWNPVATSRRWRLSAER